MNYFLVEAVLGIAVMIFPFLLFVMIRKMRCLHGLGIILLGIYLGMVWNVTGLPDIFNFHWEIRGGISVIPFKDFSAFGCIANVVMIMPLGFFLPLLWKNCRFFWKMFVAGCVVSIFIESLQLFTFRATDIDDPLMNTLGGAVGYGCYAAVTKWLPGWKEIWSSPVQSRQERQECISVFLVVIVLRILIYPLLSEWVIINL